MFEIISSASLSFGELKKTQKKHPALQSLMNKRTPTCSLIRPGAPGQIRLKKASSYQLRGRSRDASIKSLHFRITQRVCERACQSLQQWLIFDATDASAQTIGIRGQNIALKNEDGLLGCCTDMNSAQQPFCLPQAVAGLFKQYH